MIRTIYKCDKCGNEQDTPAQFWTVGVTANHALYVGNDFVNGKSMNVCRKCLESFGIHVQTKPDDPKHVEPPTLEDLIIEIVQRAVGA